MRYLAAGLASLALLYSGCSKKPDVAPVPSSPVQQSEKPVEKSSHVPQKWSDGVSIDLISSGAPYLFKGITVNFDRSSSEYLANFMPLQYEFVGVSGRRPFQFSPVFEKLTLTLKEPVNLDNTVFVIYGTVRSRTGAFLEERVSPLYEHTIRVR